MDKLERFEKILNLVERARRLDFLAVEVMERVNKQNIDFYNFYSKIDRERNNQFNENILNKECTDTSTAENSNNTDTVKKEKQMETKPEYSEEALRAFVNTFSQAANKNEHTQPQPQPQQQYQQPQQSYYPPNQWPGAHPQQPQQPYYPPNQWPGMPPQQPFYPQNNWPMAGMPHPYQNVPPPQYGQQPINPNIPTTPEGNKDNEQNTQPKNTQNTQFFERMKSLSEIISERIKTQTDSLKQIMEAFNDTHKMSLEMWKDFDNMLSKNKANEK